MHLHLPRPRTDRRSRTASRGPVSRPWRRHHDHGHHHGHHDGHHDPAALDEAAATSQGRRVLLWSLLILVGTAALQASVAWTSGSVALLGDSVHNLSDALTALPLLLAFRLARRPPNPRFTYGYGRAEDVAGVVVVLMILGSALLAAVEAVRRLLEPQPVHHLLAVAAAAVVGCIGNEVVAGYRIRSGHRIGSAALVADGLHARTDGLTSLAVLVGVAGSALGWRLADPVVGLVITVAILGVARSAVREVGGRLLDAVDPLLVDGARGALLAGEEIHSVHDLRLRWIGHRLHAEARVAVAPQLDVAAMTDLTRAAEHRLRGRLPLLERLSLQVVADA